MRRIIVSLVALFALTAFAPAPFPRSSRGGGDGNEITIKTFQGTWRVVTMQNTRKDGNHLLHKWNITHIRVSDDNWTFLENDSANARYTITIDNARKPAHLDLWSGTNRTGKAPGQGLIRRRGGRVEILYVFSEAPRAVSFAQPPDNQWLLTLEKQH